MKYCDVIVQPQKDHKLKVVKTIHYKDVTVPAGYRTNGADSPRIAWFIYPPNRTDILPAVILHDYLCNKEEYAKADDIFEACLEDLGINYIDRVILVAAVRLYHFIRYDINPLNKETK